MHGRVGGEGVCRARWNGSWDRAPRVGRSPPLRWAVASRHVSADSPGRPTLDVDAPHARTQLVWVWDHRRIKTPWRRTLYSQSLAWATMSNDGRAART
jgi:hypothetical protein